MGKIKNPISFSTHFQIDPAILDKLGVLDPTLNADTKLFIDPFLLPESNHKEVSESGYKTYREHFELIIKLLKKSKSSGDVAWRTAKRLLQFPEINGTCLGYGAQSITGSGSGAFTTEGVIRTAKEVVDLGIEDPDLFVALGIFEAGIGPDRISDMTTNVIFGDLLTFNQRILKSLNIPTTKFAFNLKNGNSYQCSLPQNPYEKKPTPIILVPRDILRDLPIVKDWSDVSDAASKNEALRHRVNRQVGKIWKRKTLKDKEALRDWALSSHDSFDAFLDLLKSVNPKPYDFEGDPEGEIIWRRIAETISSDAPFKLEKPKKYDLAGICAVVEAIISQFHFLIEKRRLSEDLYYRGNVRPERAAQRLFFAVAYSYCKANNLDITPEADTGNGPVDFKVSSGFIGRVLVEIKLSTNSKLIPGYEKQLATYKSAEETFAGYYVVIDVGSMGKKAEKLLALKNAHATAGKQTSEIIFIDGQRRKSASKLS